MNLSNNTLSQKKRLLDYLRLHNRITTVEARTALDVMHPAARVQELKADGHDIITYRRVIHTGMGSHRVGEYVLLSI